ncbi:hypothetical protein IEQ34_005802 [Dendrobium chrysotoxum]|uniref:Uncharacterized protein n=1 Tax=Dendrobium chrysotoxum TaxID=161865 RepID=A0AAV7HC99_DENCH|nr:hypothetical protein IEQ34_005802 [Dendrobium chrysotoxum]
MYEMTLHAGLRFPLAPELLEIFRTCGVPLAQFLCRTVTIIVGLTAFYRERGAKLTVDHLSKMCRLTRRILCRGKKWLDFSTRDHSKNWSSSFFFVKNDWGRLKELPNFPHLGEEEILKTLNFSDTKSLQEELCRISQYVMEEKLFKVGLSIQAGRSHAVRLKKSKKAQETKTNQKNEVLKALTAEKNTIEIVNKELQYRLLEKEEAILDADARTEAISLEAVEKFKKSSAYRREIQNHVQETYNKLFDAEARNLERQCLEEGFALGWFSAKTGVTIEGLSPSQASEDPSADLDDDDVESELRKVLSSDDEDVEIM